MSKLKAAMALGVIFLAVALIGTALIDSTNSDRSENLKVAENESTLVTERLQVTSERIRPTQDTALIKVANTETLNASTQQLNVTETATYTIDGETVDVTLNSAVQGDNEELSRLTVVYSPYFGWSDAPRTIMQNMGLLIALVGFMMVAALLRVVLK